MQLSKFQLPITNTGIYAELELNHISGNLIGIRNL